MPEHFIFFLVKTLIRLLCLVLRDKSQKTQLCLVEVVLACFHHIFIFIFIFATSDLSFSAETEKKYPSFGVTLNDLGKTF